MVRFLSDVVRTMRLAIGRRNENDPSSSDAVLLQYINDFVNLTMSDDVKLFENFGTLEFDIDESHPDGVWSLYDPNVNASGNFVNYSMEAFISLVNLAGQEPLPEDSHLTWNPLDIFQDPGRFYAYWGVDNFNVLIPGMPTEMLYYGTDFVFRTIPNGTYHVTIYAYKQMQDFSNEGNPVLGPTPDAPLYQDYWLRYIAYGAALNYVRDYRFDPQFILQLASIFSHERKLLLTRTHNQIKQSRCLPRF